MSETIIVNLRYEKCDIKITRTSKHQISDPPNFGCYGNPFFLEKYGRKRCIELFKEYFDKRIVEDIAFKNAVLALKGLRLGCFCKSPPGVENTENNACHGDIIKEYLDNYKEKE